MIAFGCAWYPEQWPESQWQEDLALMRQAGMNMVRIAEFAWNWMEPAEGHFDLDWLERAVELAGEYGMSVVLGTPTAAPPVWLTQRYPEARAIREDGKAADHGTRWHYSPLSMVYLRFCQRIAEAMARRFGRNPHVIGWQIDNEFNSFSFDEETRQRFQEWLKARFGTLEELAQRWVTAYWRQDFTEWSQIPLPVNNHNPGLALAFRQFKTHVFVEFLRVQIEAIRRHTDGRQWITHNFMKWCHSFDHYEVCKALDFAAWDNYVPSGHLDYAENGAMHDLVRGFKRKNFWLMETQPGQVNWVGVNTTLDRGEVRTMAWHAIGHGADAVSYWQWRCAPGGQEQMHGSLVATDGKPRPVYQEVAQIGRELEKANRDLEGTSPAAQIALLQSYEDHWAIDLQRHHQDFDPIRHLLSYYRPLRAPGHAVDIIHPQAPLAAYKLVIGAHLNLLDAERSQHLLAYVKDGGHLALGIRTGVKDAFNGLLPSRQPGPLAESLGAHVEEYYALGQPISVSGDLGEGTASIWAEQLQVDAPDARVLLRYGLSNGWLDGQPAMVTQVVGTGRMTYIGAWLDDGLMEKITTWLLEVSGLSAPWSLLPAGVEVCRRASEDRQIVILINHTPQPQVISLPQPCTEVLLGQAYEKTLSLPARGVAVLRADRADSGPVMNPVARG